MKNPLEQIELLMYGTMFPDEQTPEGRFRENTSRTSLRTQMREELHERLKEGRPLKVYLGVDPTRLSLHIGHLLPVLKLKVFQDLGHEVTFLIGDYTGMIGDPSNQAKERQKYSHDELLENAKGYTDQAFKVLDPKKTRIRYNGEWLGRLDFKEIIQIASYFPLKQIIARKDFQERLEKGLSLRFHETLYALMQGYDAYALDCDVQVGAYDQYFNMLAGRIIQENKGQKPHIMITVPLLMGTDGRKMSKSFGNTINVLEKPEDMYAKVMRISDDMIEHYLMLATDFENEEKERLAKEIGKDPMGIKKGIAFNITQRYHGLKGAEDGERSFREISQARQIPEEVMQGTAKEIKAVRDEQGRVYLPKLLVDAGIVSSGSEARRLIDQKGLKMHDKDQSEIVPEVINIELPLGEYIIQKGKHTFVKIRIVD